MKAGGWLAIASLAAAGWLLVPLAGEPGRIKSDLLSLLPPDPGGSMRAAALASLSQASGNRAFFLAEGPDATSAGEAADTLAGMLQADSTFSSALSRFPEPDLSSLGAFFLGQGPRLPGENSGLARQFLQRLHAAFPHPLAPDVRGDPFGRVLAWVSQIPWPSSQLGWQNGRVSGATEGRQVVLIIANLQGDALSMEFPAAAARAADLAIERTLERHPGCSVRRAGAIFHAAHAQRISRRDMELISLGSILGIVAVMLGLFRSPRMLLLCLCSIAAGLATGVAATLVVLGEIHLLVLVFGASLMGEAADYSIQLTLARISAKDSANWLSRVMPGLRLAILTSVAGYAALCLAPLPFLGQMGLFALTGLLGAFAFVRLAGPAMVGGNSPGVIPRQSAWLARQVGSAASLLGKRALGLGYVLALIGVAASTQVAPVDDPSGLIPRSGELIHDEELMRRATGTGYSQRFLLVSPVEGTDEACLRSAEGILPRLIAARDSGQIGEFATLARLVPSAQTQDRSMAEHLAAAAAQSSELARALEEQGLPKSLGDNSPPNGRLDIGEFLKLPASTPFRHLRVEASGKVAHLIIAYPPAERATLEMLAKGHPDITVVDKLGDATQSLAAVRTYGSLGIPLLLLLCLGVISVRHGLVESLGIILPTVLGICWAIPLAHLAGTPVSGLTFMALLIVVGVGVNYGIFMKEGGAENPGALAGVAACALTTLLAFGLLAFSGMPALAWIGTTLGAGILVTLASLPLALGEIQGRSRPTQGRSARATQ